MLATFLISVIFQLTALSNCFHLYETSLLDLLDITESTLNGFVQAELSRLDNPFSRYLLNDEKANVCSKEKSNKIGSTQHQQFSLYPHFQKMYSKCRKIFKENVKCAATCIFQGMIKDENYGSTFLDPIQEKYFLIRDKSEEQLNKFHLHENVFCFSREFRHTLLDIISSCKLPCSEEVCLIDEGELHCDPNNDDCHFDPNEVSVLTVQDKAHMVTCSNFDTLKWDLFKNSDKLQCILPKNDKIVSMKRPVFPNCNVCAKDKNNTAFGPLIEYSEPPSKEEFSKVVHLYQPILIRNGASFAKIKPMTLSSYEQLYKTINYSKVINYEICKDVKHVDGGFSEHKKKQMWYDTVEVCHRDIVDVLKTLIPRPSFLPYEPERLASIAKIFAGTKGNGVPLHIDYFKPTWQVQLEGEKLWFLKPPPECLLFCQKWVQFTAKPGDIVIMHINTWYHGTFIENSPISFAYVQGFDLPKQIKTPL